MKTRLHLVATPDEQRAVSATIKQDPAITALAGARQARRRSAAWDPYEVWRTRVKGEEEQTPAEDAGAPPAA